VHTLCTYTRATCIHSYSYMHALEVDEGLFKSEVEFVFPYSSFDCASAHRIAIACVLAYPCVTRTW